MKLTFLGIIAIAAIVLALQPAFAQGPTEIKVRGCLQGSGSDQNPWALRGVVIPPPPGPAPGGAGGGGGRGGAGGGRGDGAGARGGGAGAQGAAPGGGRGGAAGGGRGGDGARGAAPPAAAPAPPPQPPVDLKLVGIDMTPWRNMFVEVEGTLGPKPASGLQDFRVNTARSAYGDCR